ncbi:hypothetical protein FACS189465_0160 [Clostridia bacterium]|nr:hypothetical protein FACS189465_0160 [Clostridia bacterium]
MQEIKLAFEKIFADENLKEKLENAKNVNEMYEVATEVHDGYTIEEFEKYVFEMLSYAQKCVANGALSDEELSFVTGGKMCNRFIATSLLLLMTLSGAPDNVTNASLSAKIEIPNSIMQEFGKPETEIKNSSTDKVAKDILPLPVILNSNNPQVIIPSDVKQLKERRYMCSPFGVYEALMMATEGAADNSVTKNQLLNAFGITDLNATISHLKTVNDKLNSSGCVKVTNSIWLNRSQCGDNADFSDAFKTSMLKNFSAHAESVNSTNAVKIINSYVKENTNGKISSILNPTDNNFLTVLLNTIHLKADWLKPFKKENTKKRDFTDDNGKVHNIDFMIQENRFDYFENEKMQLIVLKYANGVPINMVIALPKAGQEITSADLEYAIANKKPELVNIKLPKFKGEFSYELNNDIKNFGVINAFDKNCPDFRDVMFKNIGKDKTVYVSKVIQKTFIDVDEKGTEAAAATAVKMSMMSGCVQNPKIVIPKNFDANKPFLYALRYDGGNNGGENLFIGRQTFE